jgi:uncharacterized protein (TIRG00374 family)
VSEGLSQAAGGQPAPGRDQRDRSQHSRAILWIALPLAAVLLYLALRDLDWVAFWDTIRHGHYEFLLLMIPIDSISYFIRALRWSVLVRSEAQVSVRSVFWANMVGYMGNLYLPARAGELLRAAFLGREKGLGTSFVLATGLSERVLDAVALVVIGTVAFLSEGELPATLANAVRLMAVAGVVGLAFIVAAPYQERVILRTIGWLPLPERASCMVAEQTSRFLLGIRSLQNVRRMLAFLALTAIVWLVDSVGVLIVVRVISQSLNLGQALVLLAALGLSSALPSTPGYIGVYQFVAVAVLMPFGFSRGEALAYILIGQVLNYAVVSSWGLLGLWQIQRGGDAAPPPEECKPHLPHRLAE